MKQKQCFNWIYVDAVHTLYNYLIWWRKMFKWLPDIRPFSTSTLSFELNLANDNRKSKKFGILVNDVVYE